MWLSIDELKSIRRITRTNKSIPIEFVEGNSPPVKVGTPSHASTHSGKFIRDVAAYRRVSATLCKHIPSTERVQVGIDWIEMGRNFKHNLTLKS